MLGLLVYAFVSLRPFFNPTSAAVRASGHEDSPWFIGCVDASDSSLLRLHPPEGVRDLDPAPCSARCLHDGYQVAALTFESCYCGNQQLQGLVFSECLSTSTSSSRGSDERERQSDLSLPVGGGQGMVALYRTEGSFLHSVSLSTSPDRVQAGKTFVVGVSGNLAGRPDQPTGIPSLAGQDLSFVTVEFLDTAPKGQSSHHVSVLEDGSFFVFSEWSLETPGEYEINVSVSNLLSTLSSTLRLSVSQPAHGPVISVLPGPLGVPSSCVHPQQATSKSTATQPVFVGDPVTLQAHMGEGLATGFGWCFDHEKRKDRKEMEEERKCVKTTCFPNSDCLNSTLNWTFETEGVYTVTVNASGATGWTQQTIHVVAALPAVSDLKVNVWRNHLTAGESISLDVELLTTMKHLLLLDLTMNVEHDSNVDSNSRSTDSRDTRSNISNDDTSAFSDEIENIYANATYSNDTESHMSKIIEWENIADHDCNYSNHGNIINDHNFSQGHGDVCCHGGTHHLIPLHPLQPSHRSGCRLRLHLCCRLPNAAGRYRLTVSVLSAPHPSSVLLSTVLPQALMVYEHIWALRPSGNWTSAVPTHAEFSLEVGGQGGRMGSRIIWTFSLDNAPVVNRTTEEWHVNVSLPSAGRYRVTVKAFNPVSWALFHTHILVQDPVGELVLNVPRVIRTQQEQLLVFSVAAGSNVTVSLLVNATSLYRNSSYVTGEEMMAVLLFNHTGTVVAELRAENRVSSLNKSVRVCVEVNGKSSPQVRDNPNWQPTTSESPSHSLADNVRIYAAKPAYATNTDVTFQVVADAPDLVEFIWQFGDSTSARTTSRTVTKRYHKPGRFAVVAVASAGRTSVTSEAFPLVVQRAVRLNRLVHPASVLQNRTATVSCRVNVGTDLSFRWSFGDGSSRLGQSAEQHVFHRTGEFRVEVTVSNLVSSASLSSHIFVVDRPCQPPPVKNMGPLKLQVRRYEVIRLGVTYETEIDCDAPGGLQYTWTVLDSAGRILRLPLTDTHTQGLTLQSHLLQCDTYTATARVQVVGSVVYSNYSVRVQVMPSPPVAFIQGGTNIFINNGNATVLTLDGQRSHDPDFPMNPLSYSWTCKPLSSIATTCFNRHISTSSPVLTFPVRLLKHDFDQFQFTLTVHSGERSASSDTFLTVVPNLLGKLSVDCPHCQGDQVNWDQSFSVGASCEDCGVSHTHLRHTWSLYLVNASSRPVTEVPFCHTVDLGAPSTITEDQTPGTSALYPPHTDSPHDARAVHSSAPALLTEMAPKTTGARKQNGGPTDSWPSAKKSRNLSTKAESEPSADAAPVSIRTTGSGEEPSYDYQGELDPAEHHPSTEYIPLTPDNSGVRHPELFGQSDIIGDFPTHSGSSAEWESSFPGLESGDMGGRQESDYEGPFPSVEEGDPGSSAGRPTGVDGETLSPGDDSVFDPAEGEGSNLVVSRPSVLTQEPTLLDLPRDSVDRDVFESYTYSGISSPSVSLRPFSLRPGSRYMLEVTAQSHNSLVGRTQLFLKTKPVPRGMTCQVQPVKGMELHTHFSIFCTSGKEDLLYEYSFSVGSRRPSVLYQGRDFQYYFSLPSGDPSDDYKVTIYTEVRSGTHGTATKPCPVTVKVEPSFLRDTSPHHDPDLELSGAGLRNLSALVGLGNSQEIRNHVRLLSGILNRLSLEAEANAQAQTHVRSVLICTVCELESGERASMVDSICTLQDLLQVTNQVTLASARRATVHVQSISDLFLESSAPVPYHLDPQTLNALVVLLSHILRAAVTNRDFPPETPNAVNMTQVLESDSPTGENTRRTTASPSRCTPASSTSEHITQGRSTSAKQATRLVVDTLQTASDLMLKYILFHKVQQHRIRTGLIVLYASYQKRTSTVVSGGSATFYVPAPLIQLLFVHHGGAAGSRKTQQRQQPCVLSVLTELARNPYTSGGVRLSGPVVDLSLFQCSGRRRIPVRSLLQPIDVELQRPPGNKSSVHEYVLLRSRVSYHSFNITQDHLQQAFQLSVAFRPLPGKVFPIMLLFRMFERPTPSMHHLRRVHHWESNSTRITLPPAYFNTAGVGHLALLNADFGKASGHKHMSERISYSLTVVSSQCLSWDDQQGAWTHEGCRTQQTDTTTAVNCSCDQLRPLTVVQQQIQSSHGTADLDPFLSVPHDLTVLLVLVLFVCLYVPGLVACKRADVISGENGRVHYLPDNSPFDPHLYAVTIHTGLCSAASMSAKVYIVLYGEDGFSHTRELQVPGCTLFRRNARDTFILSAADSLGPVWGVHIWHDGSGLSPDWYLKHVEVSEVNGGHVKGRAWLLVTQCWVSVNKGDGQVERMLRVCSHRLGFAEMLRFKLSDLLADFHIWMSVYSCPCPNLFTHTQRLSVCLLLLLGYACVNTVIISQMDDQLPFELGVLDVSAVSVTTGVLSVVAVLPGATMISFLFRLHEVKLTRSGAQHAKDGKTDKDYFEDTLSVNPSAFHLSWRSLKQWIQEAWRKKHQGTDLLSVSTSILESKDTDKEPMNQPDVIVRREDGLTVESRTGPVLQNLSLISKGEDADHVSQIKEIESSMFCGTQKDPVSSMRDEDEVKARRVGPTYQQCHYLAWALCLLLSLSCLALSGVLGIRFSSSKVLLWTHSLFFSLMCCIFVIQPVVILIVAVTVSFWYRKRADFHTFSRIEELQIQLCSGNSANLPEEQFRPEETCSYLQKLLATRQRARYLRLVRPPTAAELRRTRGRKRRETLIHNTLRDLSVCVSMVGLMLCATYGSPFGDHYHLNKAVRKQFIRIDYENDFMSVQKREDWWKWTRSSLLNLLYKNASAKTEQSHILIGEPILWKMEAEASSSLREQASDVTLVPERFRSFLSGSRTSTYPHSIVTVPTATPPRTCGRLGCYSGPSTTVGLGHTKSDAASKLNLLHSGGWFGRRTMVLKVQFTLFSPAPNLFTSVTLLAEQSPTNVLLPSSKVQSARVYRTSAVWDYVVMVCQLIFLFMSLLQLCVQVCTARQQGLMGYWRTPCNWLEVALLTVTLVYYVYHIHHSIIIMDAVEQLHRHRGHVEVSTLASWEQDIRALSGVTLLLLATKCVTLLRVNRTVGFYATLLTRSLSSLMWPTVSGLILLVGLSCAGSLLFAQSSGAFSSILRSLQTLLSHHWGLRPARSLLLSGRDFLFGGTLYLSSSVVWTAVLIAVVSSSVRGAKRSQSRRDFFTEAELASYFRRRVFEFAGRQKPKWTDDHVESRTYYLEEFESLVDELLFRLTALSNGLHHTLPPKLHHYLEEHSPVTSPIQEPSNADTQEFARAQMKEETIRSKYELEVLQLLQQRGQRRHDPSPDVVSDNQQQTGGREEENLDDRELRSYFRGQNCLSPPESASSIRIWTQDVLEKRADQWTGTNDSRWLSTTQTTHTEVVVEVLVHKEPGSAGGSSLRVADTVVQK